MGSKKIQLLASVSLLLTITACKPKVDASVTTNNTTVVAASSSSSSTSSSSSSNGSCPTAALFSGGSGTLGDPYQICKLADIEQLNTKLSGAEYNSFKDKYYQQTADIDFGSVAVGYVPIGSFDNAPDFSNILAALTTNPSNKPFIGTYDGNNKKISNLKFETSTLTPYLGLFRSVGTGGVVKNLIVENPTFSGPTAVSGTVAAYSSGDINHITVTGLSANFGSSGIIVGGVVGNQQGGVGISHCSASGSMTGSTTITLDGSYNMTADTENLAGIVAVFMNIDSNVTPSLSHVSSSVNITAGNSPIGVAAIVLGQVTVDHASNTGSMNSQVGAAGVIGIALYGEVVGINGLNKPALSHLSNSGSISVSGLVADQTAAAGVITVAIGVTISDSYNTGSVSNTHKIGGNASGFMSNGGGWVELKRIYNTGDVTYTYTGTRKNPDGTDNNYGDAAGLVAFLGDQQYFLLEDSYSTGLITADANINDTGGLIADLYNIQTGSSITIRNCYTSNTFSGGQSWSGHAIGGLNIKDGDLPTFTFQNIYWNSDISGGRAQGFASSGTDINAFTTQAGYDLRNGIIGLTTAQMKDSVDYATYFSGFNFTTKWNAPDGTLYPSLK